MVVGDREQCSQTFSAGECSEIIGHPLWAECRVEGGFYNRCVYLIQEELRKAQLRTERIEGVILPEFEKDMSSFTDLLNSMLADDYAECSQTLSAAECDSIIYHPLKLWNKCRLANEGSLPSCLETVKAQLD